MVTSVVPLGSAMTPAALDRPDAERYRSVPAGGRESVSMPEQGSEIGTRIIGWS